MFGIHWFDAMFLLFSPLIPLIIGIVWMRPDASRRGQPGWLWALLTIPLRLDHRLCLRRDARPALTARPMLRQRAAASATSVE